MITVGETFILYLAKKERKAFESHIEIFAILERKAVNRRWRPEEILGSLGKRKCPSWSSYLLGKNRDPRLFDRFIPISY